MYSKQGRHNNNKCWRIRRNNNPIKKCANLKTKLLKTAYNSKVEKLNFDEDPLQHWSYLLTLMNPLYIVLSHFKETCMILIDYPPSIIWEDLPDYAKHATCNLLHA